MAFAAPKKLVFLHIPKTAGSSVGRFFDAQFNPQEICLIYDGNIKTQLAAALEDDNIRFIRGHFGLYKPLLEQLPNPDIFVFTFLREPVQRILSLYNHMQRKQSVEHKNRMKSVASLPDFLALKTDYNEQTRYLSGVQDKSAFHENPEKAFQAALSNLDLLGFIGHTENLENDLAAICSALGFEAAPINIENKGLSRLKQQLLLLRYQSIIAKQEVWDLKLYRSLSKKRP